MKREVTFINCDQCEAELSRSDDYWDGKERKRHRDYWELDTHVFCGDACARAYFDARITEYQGSQAEWLRAQVPTV